MKKMKCEVCKQTIEDIEYGTVLRRGASQAEYCPDCIEKRCLWCRRCERTYDSCYTSNRDCPRCGERGMEP